MPFDFLTFVNFSARMQLRGFSRINNLKERINNQIRSKELRVIDNEGNNLGVLSFAEALKIAMDRGEDLIEISPEANPPVAKIMEWGKYQYDLSKKMKKMKAGSKTTETKSLQIKIATSDHDLEMKAKKASEWLSEGHRIKIELYLSGRTKYMKEDFLKERLDRILKFITTPYKLSEPHKKSPKGIMVTVEKEK